MFKRLKKYIALMLCAALLNACVLPSTALLAVKTPHIKRQVKPSVPKSSGSKPKEEKKQADDESPTLSESWEKVINLEWRSLTKADAWNIGTSSVAAIVTSTLAYALFKSKPGNAPHEGPGPDMPDDKPNVIPEIPAALQNIYNDSQYEPEYKEKIEDLCNKDYREQLRSHGLDGILNELKKEIAQADDKSVENIKKLIDHRYEQLQKHVNKETDKKKDEKLAETSASDKTTTPVEKKPISLYPCIDQAEHNGTMAKTDVTVPHQKGLLCGIHALHDGNYINEKFMQENNATVLHNLNNLSLVSEQIHQERITANTDFEAHCNAWTDQTGRKRQIKAGQKYIGHQLHRCMSLTEEEQQAHSGWLNKVLCFFGAGPLHTLTQQESNSRDLIASILKEAITHHDNQQGILLWNDADAINLEELYQLILNLAPQYNRNLNDIQQQADLHAFINSLDTTKLKNNFDRTLRADERFFAKAASHVRYYHQHLSTDFSGENLDSEELDTLITDMGKRVDFAYDNKGNLLIDAFNPHDGTTFIYNLHGKISTINDSTNILPDSRDGTIIAVIKHQMNQCHKFVHTFMIRLGAAEINSAHSTHWISVTLVRVNNKNHYFITDSIGARRANDHNVLHLIEALEQPDVPQPIEDNQQLSSQNGAIDRQAANSNVTHTHNETTTQTSTLSPHAQNLASIQTVGQVGSSCAYHAAHNANDIVRVLQEMPADLGFEQTAAYISDRLCSDESKAKIALLFDEENKTGEWRDITKTNRLLAALKESIYHKFLQSVARTKDQIAQHHEQMIRYTEDKTAWDKRLNQHGHSAEDPMPQEPTLPDSTLIDNTTKQCLRSIAHACATQLAQDNKPIMLASNSNLQKTLMHIILTTNPALLHNREENFNTSIALLNATELAKNFGEAITIENGLRNNLNQIRELIGDDLDADELRHLLNNSNIENAAHISIIARTDAPNWATENSYSLSEVIPVVKAKMRDNNCTHAFLIRAGFSNEINDLSGEIHQSNNGTHWICVVLYRVDGHNHYIIADSLTTNTIDLTNTLNKNNRTNDPDVHYLIAMLES